MHCVGKKYLVRNNYHHTVLYISIPELCMLFTMQRIIAQTAPCAALTMHYAADYIMIHHIMGLLVSPSFTQPLEENLIFFIISILPI